MSDANKPSDGEPLKKDTGAPRFISAERRETLVAGALLALLLVDIGLIYVLYL